MDKFKQLVKLFLTMFKIGLFTFGGGYAMIAVLQTELVEKKKWIEEDEFVNLIAIAESTPGPIAINSATYIGYLRGGVFGSAMATLGVVLPSFIIIFTISLFFEAFLALEFVGYAFRGIQACVAFLIISAGIKMFKGLKKSAFNLVIFITAFLALTLIDLFGLDFSIIYMILAGGLVGVITYAIKNAKNKKAKKIAQAQQEDMSSSKQEGGSD